MIKLLSTVYIKRCFKNGGISTNVRGGITRVPQIRIQEDMTHPPSSADETSSPINYSGRTPPPPNLLSSANNDIEKKIFAVHRELISTTKSQKTQTGQKRVKCLTCSKTFICIGSHKCKGQKPSLI